MTRVSTRRFFVLATAIAVAGTLTAPAAYAQSQQEVDQERAEAERAYEEFVRVQDQVDAAIAHYEDVRSEIFDVEYRLDRLEERITDDTETAKELEEIAKELALEAYKSGSMGTFRVALEAKSIQDVVTTQALFEKANAASVASLDRLEALTRELGRLTESLDADREHLAVLEADANRSIQEIELVQQIALEWYEREDAEAVAAKEAWEEELERRREAERIRRARERARRQRELAGRTHVYDYLRCPQANPKWFRNDWGNPRSGGRTHKGTDIFGPRGEKVYAVYSGTLRKRTGGLGGNAWWLYGDDGNAYYFAHLDRWARGLETGDRVKRGQVIAYVGNTGNASGGASHTHFQLHPRGGAPVNPYYTLRAIC